MPRRRSPASDETTRERLLDAATGVFGRSGYERARLEDIAKEVGITRPSLLHHFPTKEALYRKTMERAFVRLSSVVDRAMLTPGGYEDRLESLVGALMRFNEEHHSAVSMILDAVLRDDDPVARAEVSASFVPLVDRLEAFVRLGSGGALDCDHPVRASILQLIFGQLIFSSLGEFGRELWRGDASTMALARLLLLPSRTR